MRKKEGKLRGQTKHILSATFPQNLRKATEFLGFEGEAKKCLRLPLIKTTDTTEVSMILSKRKEWEGIFKPANLILANKQGFEKEHYQSNLPVRPLLVD